MINAPYYGGQSTWGAGTIAVHLRDPNQSINIPGIKRQRAFEEARALSSYSQT
jgi:hypothetical protein